MRERQDAYLRSSQTGHRRDRCRVQRGLHHGRQYLAAFQGNYPSRRPFRIFEALRMDGKSIVRLMFLCVSRVAFCLMRLNSLTLSPLRMFLSIESILVFRSNLL